MMLSSRVNLAPIGSRLLACAPRASRESRPPHTQSGSIRTLHQELVSEIMSNFSTGSTHLRIDVTLSYVSRRAQLESGRDCRFLQSVSRIPRPSISSEGEIILFLQRNASLGYGACLADLRAKTAWFLNHCIFLLGKAVNRSAPIMRRR